MRPHGIRSRILLLALLPGAVIAWVLSAYFTSVQLRTMEQHLLHEGETLVTQLAPLSEFGVVTGNPEILEQLVLSLMGHQEVVWVGIEDAQGALLQQSGPLPASWLNLDVVLSEPGLCGGSGTTMLFCAPIHRTRLPFSDFDELGQLQSTQPVIGQVFVEMSTRYNRKRQLDFIFQSLLLISVLLMVTSLIALYVGYRIAHPVILLRKTVERVARGDLEVRARPGSQGEILSLIKA